MFKKLFIQIEADYKNVPEFKVKLFFGFLKCSIFNYVFKKEFTPAHMGRFTLPILSQILNIQSIWFEHYANSKSRKDNPYENI